jgi:hypothetical protein
MDSRWGSTAAGAGAGAYTGAKLGSLAGPGWGTAIGAGLGTVIGGLGGYFSHQPDKFGEINNLTPEQQSLLSNINGQMNGQGGQNYQAAQSYLGNLLNRDPSTYDRFAQPYMQQFEQQTIPRLSEQFAGLGGGLGGGVNSSSGFGQAIGGAGAGLQSQLAQMFAQLQQNASGQSLGQYNQLANLGLGTRAFQPSYQPGNIGFTGQLASGLAQGVGRSIGNEVGGGDLLKTIMEYMNKDKATGTDLPQWQQ